MPKPLQREVVYVSVSPPPPLFNPPHLPSPPPPLSLPPLTIYKLNQEELR